MIFSRFISLYVCTVVCIGITAVLRMVTFDVPLEFSGLHLVLLSIAYVATTSLAVSLLWGGMWLVMLAFMTILPEMFVALMTLGFIGIGFLAFAMADTLLPFFTPVGFTQWILLSLLYSFFAGIAVVWIDIWAEYLKAQSKNL